MRTSGYARHAPRLAVCVLAAVIACGGGSAGVDEGGPGDDVAGDPGSADAPDVPIADPGEAGDPGGDPGDPGPGSQSDGWGSGWRGDTYYAVSPPIHIVLNFGFPQDFPVVAGTNDRSEGYNLTAAEFLVGMDFGLRSVRIVPSELLQYATFTTSAPPAAETPEPLRITLRTGENLAEATVCEDGDLATSLSIPLDKNYQPTGVAGLPDAEFSATSLERLNTLDLSMCFRVEAPVDGTLTLSHLPVWLDLFLACDSEPTNLAGHWAGTYTCGSSCGAEDGGDVELDVTQNGPVATYVDDGGASYTGAVCGDQFLFVGGREDQGPGDPSYSEAGTLTFVDSTTATKRSFWYTGQCGGACADDLKKQ